MNFVGLSPSDPNAVLQDPSKPYNPTTNPVVGFQVYNDLLTLNGYGFNFIGALHNLGGTNGWDGNVVLGSATSTQANVYIGVAAPVAATKTTPATTGQLTIGGVVSDYAPLNPALDKVGGGRLVLNNVNTFTGATTVSAGQLNIRDSSSLSASATVAVNDGGSLELQTDSGLDGTALRTHNRNLGSDSITTTGLYQNLLVPGTVGTFTLSFNGQTTTPINAGSATLATDIQAALNKLSTVKTPLVNGVPKAGLATVYQSDRMFHIAFTGTGFPPGTAVPLIVSSAPAVAAIQPLFTQEVVVGSAPGTFKLSYKGVTQTTPAISDTSATLAADIQAALNSISTVAAGGGSAAVTQAGGVFRVAFSGGSFGPGANVPLVVATAVTGTAPVINPVDGLVFAQPITIAGAGSGGGGALRSAGGINTVTGLITLDINGSSIGVDADTRAGHPTADASYFTNDYSLTAVGGITNSFTFSNAPGALAKQGAGQLILPTANKNLTGAVNIKAGWITAQNELSLGSRTVGLGDTVQPDLVTVTSGAALVLKPLVTGTSFAKPLANNLILAGTGISHPFATLNNEGALINLGGHNTISGDVGLNGTTGIGVQKQNPANAVNDSELTLTGSVTTATPPATINVPASATAGRPKTRTSSTPGRPAVRSPSTGTCSASRTTCGSTTRRAASPAAPCCSTPGWSATPAPRRSTTGRGRPP